MNDFVANNVEIIVSFIIGFLTLLVTYANTRKQLATDKKDRDADNDFNNKKLQEEIENTLWGRAQTEIDRLNTKIDTQDETILQLNNKIAILQQHLQTEQAERIVRDKRIEELEHEIRMLESKLKIKELENNKLTKRVRELERRAGTGPLGNEKAY